jgi:hypothetical protein
MPLRDTAATTFSGILGELLAHVPGALGAVLVDREGEAVDYAGRTAPFDLRLAGAHWQIVLRPLAALVNTHARALGAPRALVVRGGRRSFVARFLPDDYILVVVLSRRAGFSPANCAFAVCEHALAKEAGWRRQGLVPPWFALDVVSLRRGRPFRIERGGHETNVEVLGQAPGLVTSGKAWRVRLDAGAELTLVCEPGGHWYSDEPLGFVPSLPPRA